MGFPTCFPEGFEENILPKQMSDEPIQVYRAIEHGTITRDDFISTFEKVLRGIREPMPDDNAGDPSYYSTSCSTKRKKLECILHHFMLDDPKAQIVKGETAICCGPSARTKEWNKECKNNYHVDWWIYAESHPEDCFQGENHADPEE